METIRNNFPQLQIFVVSDVPNTDSEGRVIRNMINIKHINSSLQYDNVPITGVGLGHFKGLYNHPKEGDYVLVGWLGEEPVVLGTINDFFSQTPDVIPPIKENELIMVGQERGQYLYMNENGDIILGTPDGANLKIGNNGEFLLNGQPLSGGPGPVGPQGPKGGQGDQGPAGPAGPIGIQGPIGMIGPVGPHGNTGPEGPAGTDGNDGATGPRGLPGADGQDGAQGLPGADGQQGIQGQPGTDGNDGATGPRGLPGADGQDGAQGPPGADGQDGAQGPPGADGNDGSLGADGAQGQYIIRIYQSATSTPLTPTGGMHDISTGVTTPPTGWSIDPSAPIIGETLYFSEDVINPSTQSGVITPSWSLPVEAGGTGPQGPAGPPGADGNDGATGPRGPPGADGQDGAQGPPGTDGTDGQQGSPGTDGTDGQQGPPGTDGTDGQQGPPGTDGTDGQQGPPGADGADGTDGTDGQQGPPGADGTDGTDGTDGQQGPPGADGTDGQQGPPGADGNPGADGQQGPPGVDGTDGQDGADGTIVIPNPSGTSGTDLTRLEINGADYNLTGGSGGEDNVQANWDETDTSDDSFILNKPITITQSQSNKLDNIEADADVNPTNSEIVDSINNQLGNTNWQISAGTEAYSRTELAVNISIVTNQFPVEVSLSSPLTRGTLIQLLFNDANNEIPGSTNIVADTILNLPATSTIPFNKNNSMSFRMLRGTINLSSNSSNTATIWRKDNSTLYISKTHSSWDSVSIFSIVFGGPIGPPGNDGNPGADGTDGTDGQDGAVGPMGLQGTAGD